NYANGPLSVPLSGTGASNLLRGPTGPQGATGAHGATGPQGAGALGHDTQASAAQMRAGS
ncbi:MAG: Gly-Xaa-Xaa repeat protein, partial [Solirubrobacteraceae bacterium]